MLFNVIPRSADPLWLECEDCDWTYWGDGGKWRLARIDLACPVHGPEVTRRAPGA